MDRSESLMALTNMPKTSSGMKRSLSQVFMPTCRFAAVEGGGTTFRVAIAEGDPTNVKVHAEFPTTTPAETLGKVCAWLSKQRYDAIGIASFGPIDPTPGSRTFGFITTTPKPGWKNTDIVGPIMDVRRVPFMFDTDVNAPAMAEFTLGGLRRDGCSSCAYITVGTGIGVGLVVNGQCVHGLLHPEAGMVSVPRFEGDVFQGRADMAIPTSVEAMAASGAIAKRAGVPTTQLAKLPDSHRVWDEAAHYLAGLVVNLVLIASPERIVLGGGVMQRECLYPKVRAAARKMLNGYIAVGALRKGEIDDFVVPSIWGNDAGMVGALSLGQVALLNYRQSQALGVQTSAPVDARRGSTTYGFVTKLERQGDDPSSSQVPVQKRRSGSKRKGIGGFLAKQHPFTVAAASATVGALAAHALHSLVSSKSK